MKLSQINNKQGFTLAELMIALAISSVTLAATLIASISLQKSFNAVDNYFATQNQQIRIIEYLSRDVRRSYIVTSASSPQTVTCTIPNYIIQCGDPDANTTCTGTPPVPPSNCTPPGCNIGTRRTPMPTMSANGGIIVDYGAANGERTVSDAVTSNNSATLTSALANFTAADVGKSIAGTWIPTGTTIQSYTNATTVTMSNSATANASGLEAVIGASTVVYSISNQSILRTENGTLTTIASSTDNLLPSWLDVTLSNTEYLNTSITFLPIFTSWGGTVERSGTTLFSTAYLRIKRRG
jgi:prepilin-type N-terminal cleavage/methylation domain-containing protein